MNDVPTSRTYIHQKCGGGTIVSGDDFETLSNPFAFSSGTMCATCNSGFPLKQFVWADTGETIAAYRRRLLSEAPIGEKLISWLISPVVFGFLGAGIGHLIKPGQPEAQIAGFLAGVLVFLRFLMPLVTKTIFKVDYRTYK